MKRLLPSCFFLFLFLGFITTPAILHAESENGKWVLLGFTKYRDALFMDKNTIPYHNHVRVWAKIAPSRKSKYYEKIRNELKKEGKSAQGYKYSEILNEINCGENMIRYLQITHYHRRGTEMHTFVDSNPEWKSIPPGSLWETMRHNVCKK